jgi:hydrogenase expression/formation protein HypD
MKYLDEYRDGELTRKLLAEITQTVTRPWKIMEVCGGQTHSIIKSGMDSFCRRRSTWSTVLAARYVSPPWS